MSKCIYKLYKNSPKISKNCHLKLYKEYCITNDNALLMILYYSLSILKNNDNAIALLFLLMCQMSGYEGHSELILMNMEQRKSVI